jgi:hypothetical protein
VSDRRIVDPFNAALHRKVMATINSRMVSLARGSAGSHEEYQRQVGFMEGLQSALDLAMEIEHARYGDPPKESESQ